MTQAIIDEYRFKRDMYRKSRSWAAGMTYSKTEDILQSLRDQIGYVNFSYDTANYKVLALPENIDRFTKKMEAAKRMTSGAKEFAAKYRAQTKTTVRQEERERIMAELSAAGEYEEVQDD